MQFCVLEILFNMPLDCMYTHSYRYKVSLARTAELYSLQDNQELHLQLKSFLEDALGINLLLHVKQCFLHCN